nr:MAG TPA: hydrogenase expression/formation protein [Caudoviricetes sp.]
MNFVLQRKKKLLKHGTGERTMREITKADMDKPIEPKMARDVVTAVRDIAAYLTVGEWCLIMAGVKKAVERMTQEENNEI